MPLYYLDQNDPFPPVSEAGPDGLLAFGGDLSTRRLLQAYRKGIFPWYDEDPILWWCPDPRFVLFPDELKVSKSMRPLLKNQRMRFAVNTAFREVMICCQQASRPGQNGTWINEDIIKSYTDLYNMGYAHSAECWIGDQLAGGLYGIRLGNIFFGESMFSLVSNASKYAFINMVQLLKADGVQLVDCQVYTGHLESLGARMIPRSKFLELLEANLDG